MNTSLKNLPCIIGVAQHTYHPSSQAEKSDAPHPLIQASNIARAAAKDCGNEAILQHIDELDAVLSISWSYDNLPQQIADDLGLKKGERKLSGLSGTSPQRFLNEAAENILNGKRRAVLLCGAEAFATKKRAKKEGRTLDWPKAEKRTPPPFEDPFHPAEIAHEVFQAHTTFALLESSRRAKHGISLDDNRKQQADMMAKLSAIAANNPQAWFQKEHSAESLFNMSDKDRMVSYPFTKNTMAFMDVDMAAGIIIASNELADELNIPQEKRIYLNGWGYAKEPAYLAQRENLSRCPSMEVASQQAFDQAGISIDDITSMDLYSCFSGNLNTTKEVLGIDDDDSRSLSITGGLPYFGGPGNNYTTHSIATLVEQLRQPPAQQEEKTHYGLISGVGMNMTNHIFAVYSNQAQAITLNNDTAPAQKLIDITNEVNGDISGVIAAYTIVHGRGENSGLAICDLADGTRCYARCTDQELLEKMEQTEWVGQTVNLRCENKVNIFSV